MKTGKKGVYLMKKILFPVSLILIIVFLSSCCSINEGWKFKQTEVKGFTKSKLYCNTSEDYKTTVLYFSDFTLSIIKYKTYIIARNKNIPKVFYSMFTTIHYRDVDWASQTNFSGDLQIIHDIEKISYYAQAKIILGYGFMMDFEFKYKGMDAEEIERRTISDMIEGNKHYFIISVEPKESIILKFDSYEKFLKTAKEKIKGKEVKLQDIEVFFRDKLKVATEVQNGKAYP